MMDKHVLVIGGGTAGLSAAVELANLGIHVQLVEKSDFLGGHAIGYTCKAVQNTCVKCGACMVEEKLKDALLHPNINVRTASYVKKISRNVRFSAEIVSKPKYIDPQKCTNCGVCFERCPADGAICRGFSKNNSPFFAIVKDHCLYLKDKSCTTCRDECPESAINFEKNESEHFSEADAVLLAIGFQPFDPEDKPYGYGRFKNVVTGLDLERMLKQTGQVIRPSDTKFPQKMAFIQCVGSREAKLNHLWCSKVCCGSALRMARLIQERQPEIDIVFYYIDVQTFGKNFERFYLEAQKEIRMIRAIPGDFYEMENQRLKINCIDNMTHESIEEIFDLVVLSIGVTPCQDIGTMSGLLHIQPGESGFLKTGDKGISVSTSGIFTAGTVEGPMSIPETIVGAGNAAWQIIKYFHQLTIED